MQQATKLVIGAAIVVILVVVGWSFMKKPGVTTTAEPIKIGFIGPLTGDASSVGTGDRAAVEIAVDEVNAQGGINGRTLEMIYEDGQCTPKAAVSAANKLMSIDKVTAIVGGLCSSETSAFAPTAMQNKTIVFSYGSSAPSLSTTGKYFFRSYPSDAYQGVFSADYVYGLGARNVAVLYHVSDIGNALTDIFSARFIKLGGRIVATEGAPQDTRDYRTALTKIKALNPDYVYAPMLPDGATIMVNQSHELAMTTKFFGIDAYGDPKLVKAVSGKADILYSEPQVITDNTFKAKMAAKTNSDEIAPAAAQAYDNVKILAKVMKEIGTDPDKIAKALHAINYDGASGHIRFDANGDLVTAKYVVKRIADGQATEVK